MGIFNTANYIFNPYALPFLVVGLIAIILGLTVLLSGRRSYTHIAFFILSLTLVWWFFSQAAALSAVDAKLALFWYKIIWAGNLFIAPSAFALTMTVLNLPKKRELIALAYLTFVPYLFAVPYGLFANSVQKLPWGYSANVGMLLPAFIVLLVFFLTLCIYYQIKALRDEGLSLFKRTQAKILLVSFLIAYTAGVDLLPGFGVHIYPLGFIPLSVWLGLMAYAIIKYQLLQVTPELAAPAIITTMADPLFVTDLSGNIVITNQAASLLLGVAEKEIVGKPLKDFLPAAKELARKVAGLSRGRNILAGKEESSLRIGEKKEIPVSVSAGVIHDESGMPFGITVICHNVEGLKKQSQDLEVAKEALLKTLGDEKELGNQLKKEKANVEVTVAARTRELRTEQEALKEAKKQVEVGYIQIQKEKAKLLTSIDNLPVGFILTDPKKKILAINNKAKEILGLKEVGNLESIQKRFAASFDLLRHWEKCKIGGGPQTFGEVVFENKFLRIFLSSIAMPHDHNEFIGVVILIEDITEVKQLERSKNEFFAVAAHDMRTPLTAIRGNSALILQHLPTKLKDPSFQEMVSDIHKSSVRLISLVNDYLDVAKLEQKKFVFNKEAFNLLSLIKEVTQQLENTAAAKGLYLRLGKGDTKLPAVLADKNRTNQVLFNLIGNAIKFTEKGGVTINVKKEEGYLTVAVSDTGFGISKPDQGLLFKKFQQTGERILTRGTMTGTGLGLYISKLLLGGMDGQIYLGSSEPGSGSTFVFTLPIAKRG